MAVQVLHGIELPAGFGYDHLVIGQELTFPAEQPPPGPRPVEVFHAELQLQHPAAPLPPHVRVANKGSLYVIDRRRGENSDERLPGAVDPHRRTPHPSPRRTHASAFPAAGSAVAGGVLKERSVPAKVFGRPIEDDGGVLVRVEAVQPVPSKPMSVRVRSAVGTAVVFWQGAPEAVGREHHVEWTVDEGIDWTWNAWPSPVSSPGLREDGDRIVFRGRLSLAADGGAVLEVGDALVLFDLAEPSLPEGIAGSWVEVHVARDHVTVWPYEL
jgi:hypothetical protein